MKKKSILTVFLSLVLIFTNLSTASAGQASLKSNSSKGVKDIIANDGSYIVKAYMATENGLVQLSNEEIEYQLMIQKQIMEREKNLKASSKIGMKTNNYDLSSNMNIATASILSGYTWNQDNHSSSLSAYSLKRVSSPEKNSSTNSSKFNVSITPSLQTYINGTAGLDSDSYLSEKLGFSTSTKYSATHSQPIDVPSQYWAWAEFVPIVEYYGGILEYDVLLGPHYESWISIYIPNDYFICSC